MSGDHVKVHSEGENVFNEGGKIVSAKQSFGIDAYNTSFKKVNEDEPRSDAFYLAMFSFGMSNFLMGTYMIRAVDFDAAVLSQGFIFAGIAQLYCGITCHFKGDSIGSFICLMFGIWWQSLVGSIIIPAMFPLSGWDNSFAKGVWFNMAWLTFLVVAEIIFLATWRKDLVSPLACGCVVFTCIFVAVNAADPLNRTWAIKVAGVTGMGSGVFGFYIAMGNFLNKMYNRTIFPYGPA